ncbi:MAG TPA: DinB family protein, partial [Anaerolineae bacterium]|nr:DinB family protein [Anaerolineae bacterium]
AEGEWSLSEAAEHLLGSQQLIEQRVDLFMSNDAPNLSAKSAREMIDSAGLPAQALTLAFRKSRSHMLGELKAAPAATWERIGQHTEFGPVTLQQQVTYFAKHEHWHMAQMTRIRKALV